MRIRNFLLFIIANVPAALYAQSVVSGKVVGETGEPVVGANIIISDTYDGASADADGAFRFTTDQSGMVHLVVTAIGYSDADQEVDLARATALTIIMREAFSELQAVEITAGSFTAGDERRRTILKAVDIATTAGATADIAGALNTLPGTTKVGETGRLFVRGGDDSESRTFIDGMVALNPYDAAAPNTPTRMRFTPFMFKGTSFSTGGYSAEYGQALSSALILNSKDKAETTQTDIGILSVGGELGHTQAFNKSSLGAKISYTNISPYYKLVRQRVDWDDPYASLEGDAAYRQEIGKHGASLKLYGKFSRAGFSYYGHGIADDRATQLYTIDNTYAYGNAAYFQPINEQWLLRGGLSYSSGNTGIGIDTIPMKESEQGLHAKLVTEYAPGDRVDIRFGAELLSRAYTASQYAGIERRAASFDEMIAATFAEGEVYFSERLVLKSGVRLEHNSLLRKIHADPRISVAYKPFATGQFSFAYGTFRQSARNEYLRTNLKLENERAEHFILNYQVITDRRTFRTEVYYKLYTDLAKYGSPSQVIGNDGNGFARGAEVFWRDSKTLKNVDYWVSYSFLDTKRNYLDYPYEAVPTFASRHNFSIVFKHFITKLKSQLGLTYSFASPRPFNDPNASRFNAGRTPAYHDVSANVSYLPKSWMIIYISCTNLLGRNNIFGYEYASTAGADGVYANRPVTQPAKHLLLVGLFITVSKNKSINQLPNL